MNFAKQIAAVVAIVSIAATTLPASPEGVRSDAPPSGVPLAEQSPAAADRYGVDRDSPAIKLGAVLTRLKSEYAAHSAAGAAAAEVQQSDPNLRVIGGYVVIEAAAAKNPVGLNEASDKAPLGSRVKRPDLF